VLRFRGGENRRYSLQNLLQKSSLNVRSISGCALLDVQHAHWLRSSLDEDQTLELQLGTLRTEVPTNLRGTRQRTTGPAGAPVSFKLVTEPGNWLQEFPERSVFQP
jgi:hypothetical protein